MLLVVLSVACRSDRNTTPDPGAVAAELRLTPISEAVFGDVERFQLLQAERSRQFQEAVQACMAVEGFTYYSDSPETEIAGASFSIGEFIETSGYGVSDRLQNQLAEMVDDVTAEEPSEADAYFQSLSSREFDAYYDALDNIGGCHERATEEIRESSPEIQYFQSNVQAFDDLNDQIRADPDVVADESRWSQCMKAAGFNFTKPTQSQAAVFSVGEPIEWLINELPLSPDLDGAAKEIASRTTELRKGELTQASSDLECLNPIFRPSKSYIDAISRIESQFLDHHPYLE